MISNFKKHGCFKCYTSIICFLFSWMFLIAPNAYAQKQIQIPSGTSVMLRTNTALYPDQLNIGDTVQLSVASDVMVDGVVVIKAGAKATADVMEAKSRNLIGIAAKLGIALRSVEAVDGSLIPISGSKVVAGKDKMVASIGLSLICCILFALMKGGDASIPSGTQINAIVAGTIKIQVE